MEKNTRDCPYSDTNTTEARPTTAPMLMGVTSHFRPSIFETANETGLGTSSVRQSVMPVITTAISM